MKYVKENGEGELELSAEGKKVWHELCFFVHLHHQQRLNRADPVIMPLRAMFPGVAAIAIIGSFLLIQRSGVPASFPLAYLITGIVSLIVCNVGDWLRTPLTGFRADRSLQKARRYAKWVMESHKDLELECVTLANWLKGRGDTRDSRVRQLPQLIEDYYWSKGPS